MSARARRVTAALLLSLPGGCAHPPGAADAAGERVRAAHHAIDRWAEYAGTVIYPVAFVLAFPLYFLAGGTRNSGR